MRVLDQIGEGRLRRQRGPHLLGTDPGFRLEGSVNRAVLAEPPLQFGPLGRQAFLSGTQPFGH